MIKKSSASILALSLCLGMLTVVPVSAQSTASTARQASLSEHRQEMSKETQAMYKELREMMKDMKTSNATPEQMKEMHRHMGRVTLMLERMSGFKEEMLEQMDDMKRDPKMQSPAPGR